MRLNCNCYRNGSTMFAASNESVRRRHCCSFLRRRTNLSTIVTSTHRSALPWCTMSGLGGAHSTPSCKLLSTPRVAFQGEPTTCQIVKSSCHFVSRQSRCKTFALDIPQARNCCVYVVQGRLYFVPRAPVYTIACRGVHSSFQSTLTIIDAPPTRLPRMDARATPHPPLCLLFALSLL